MKSQLANAVSTESSFELFQVKPGYRGKERRKHERIPTSVGVIVQPLDPPLGAEWAPFYAITRDISFGGLSFLSSQVTEFETALISSQTDPGRGVVVRICGCNLVHQTPHETVYLTSVEFLYERFT